GATAGERYNVGGWAGDHVRRRSITQHRIGDRVLGTMFHCGGERDDPIGGHAVERYDVNNFRHTGGERPRLVEGDATDPRSALQMRAPFNKDSLAGGA